jgi:5-methylcytosine-specific restriction protein A
MPELKVSCRHWPCSAPAVNGQHCAAHARAPFEGAGLPMPPGWKARRRMVLARDRHVCLLCGGRAREVDHIVPRAHGGGDELSNLRSLCRACHRRVTGSMQRRRRAQ